MFSALRSKKKINRPCQLCARVSKRILQHQKKLISDAAKALDAEIEKHKAIEADLKKLLAEADQAKPVQHATSAVKDEDLA